jgi:hypothetical protein
MSTPVLAGMGDERPDLDEWYDVVCVMCLVHVRNREWRALLEATARHVVTREATFESDRQGVVP